MKKSIFTGICSILFLLAIVMMPVHAQEEIEEVEKVPVSELSDISIQFTNGTTYTYTGKEIKPKVKKVIFKDSEGQTVRTAEAIVKEYQNNIKIGKADVTISITGYEGNVTVEDAFEIVLGEVSAINAEPVTYNKIKLVWKKVKGADGYVLYRSKNRTNGFQMIKNIQNGSTVIYNDQTVKTGIVYYYKMRAYTFVNGKKVFSGYTDPVKQKAQIATAEIISVSKKTCNSLTVKWKKISGANGYGIYRANSKNGTYEKVTTVKQGGTTTYVDKNRVCGKSYYYKVAAYRTSGGKNHYGNRSPAVLGRTSPAKTKFTKETMSGEKHAALYWEKAIGATGYTIYRSTKQSSGYEAIKHITKGGILSWKDTGLKAEQVYYFKVRPYVMRNGERVYGAYSKPYKKELLSVKIENVKKYTYVPYRSGGCTTKGWDCSGFTQWATRYLHGVEIKKHSTEQASGGTKISKTKPSTWKPGDILAYSSGGRVNHVALYLGNGEIMHALNTKYDTVIQDVDYYEGWDKKNNLKCVRRYF